MVGKTNSITEINDKKPEYEQLVNYTMLYDAGDECEDVTGGWENSYTQGGGTFTKNTDNLYLYAKGPTYKKCCATVNTIDIDNYVNMYTKYKIAISNQNYCPCWWGVTKVFESAIENDSDTIKRGWLSSENSFEGFKSIDFSDVSSSNAYVAFKAQSNSISYSSTINIYEVFMVKQDNWEELCIIAGLTPSDYTDEVTLCADNTAIVTILSNKQAVEFMVYQCTGSFMAKAIQSSTFLTALNSSDYGTLVYANEHWIKFLNMVA